jgi:hypothetical protein
MNDSTVPHINPRLNEVTIFARNAALATAREISGDLDALLNGNAHAVHLALSGAFLTLGWSLLARMAPDEDTFVRQMQEPPMTEARLRGLYREAHKKKPE